jgi:hypothetical protein
MTTPLIPISQFKSWRRHSCESREEPLSSFGVIENASDVCDEPINTTTENTANIFRRVLECEFTMFFVREGVCP